MMRRTLRRALGAAALCAALPVLAPAAASASTWTVDDDKAQCPNASFRSIQAAVDQAAPWDVIVVCDGLYEEQSTPASGSGSPSQAGSVNGLTITKPLTIRGTGAAKVTIRPAAALTTLAGSAPYLRDGGGNVVTVSRQSRDATDENTMFVDISGVTIDSPNAYAEAGVAFFNANGAIRNSVVGPLRRAADGTELAADPHGWGVVATNSQQGAEAGPRRRVTIEDSLVTGYQSGGVLFDVSRGIDGAATTLQRSGIVLYGAVKGTTVQGSGPDGLIAQTGVQFHAGARGRVASSTVTGHFFTPDQRRSVGILLTDADTGIDPLDPSARAFSVTDSAITGNGWGLFNADAANAAVRLGAPAAASLGVTGTEAFWGCNAGPLVGSQSASGALNACQGVSGADGAGAASVRLGFVRRSAPPLAAVPGATADAPPTAAFSEPAGTTIVAGERLTPTVAAHDDFGVRQVSVALGGSLHGVRGTAPYEFGGWTPRFDEIGTTRTLTATVVDSSGQTTTATAAVTVVAPEGWAPLRVEPEALDFGGVQLGTSATKTVTITNAGGVPVTIAGVAVSGGGFARAGGCVSGLLATRGASCTVEVAFAPGAAGAASGALTVSYSSPVDGEPIVVALAGSGVAANPPEPRTPPVRQAGAVLTFPRSIAVRGGRLAPVRIRCDATAVPCTVRVTGTLKVGKRSWRVAASARVAAGRSAVVTVKLATAARRALRRAPGSLSLRVTSRGVRTGVATAKVTVRRG